MTDDEAERKALAWQCRRGMRELDQLLERYLDRCWPALSEPTRDNFRRLLACEDDKLWRAFLGQEPLGDAALDDLVHTIARLPH
ncbi:MAG: succinate dehydrogenase assembly factor 2 family protein [Lysobacter sp.]|nr:MAG: succinate dehydrogenase assembly factor 2 family protein [Lysobacter sp.]